MIKFTIPLPPITKKNHQQIVRPAGKSHPIVIPSKEYKQYEKDASWFIPKDKFISVPVNVKCVFYMPTKRKCDLTNLLEAIDDIMVRCGLLAYDLGNFCAAELKENALNLINRLQAENERLKNAYKQCAWERDTFLEELKTAKAEAYKEFAERLKEKYPWKDDYLYSTKRTIEDIDNLLKELVGDK